MRKIGVLLIHGAGEATFKQQEKFIKKLNKRLSKKGIDLSAICYEHIDWYAPTQSRQDKILQRLKDYSPPVKSNMLRKFIISLVSDMAIYGGMPNKPSDAYVKTHELVHQCILKLKNKLTDDSPLIVIASSMGAEIISNYIWDRQHAGNNDVKGNSAFERFETMAGLFMFGNNAPIFASSIPLEDLRPITFPSPDLPGNYKQVSLWENIYDKNDPLGFPVKCLNDYYKQCPVKDIEMNVGGLFAFWNILSHLRYWRSRKIINRIADFVEKVSNA